MAGWYRGAVVVMAGAPGTGKTILAQQVCFANGTAKHKCVYYTTVSEPHTKHVRHLEQFTFFDPQALGTRVEHIHLGDFLQPARQDGLEPLVSEIVRKTLEEEPAIVVVDSAKVNRSWRMAVTPGNPRTMARALSSSAGRNGWVKPAISRPCGPPAAPAQAPTRKSWLRWMSRRLTPMITSTMSTAATAWGMDDPVI